MCQWQQVTYSGLQSMATRGNFKTCSSTQPVRPSPLPSKCIECFLGTFLGTIDINGFKVKLPLVSMVFNGHEPFGRTMQWVKWMNELQNSQKSKKSQITATQLNLTCSWLLLQCFVQIVHGPKAQIPRNFFSRKDKGRGLRR